MTGQQLKNSILQLAIQGKLVPQNPDDESAGELLKRIREEKEKLVKEKKLKKRALNVTPIREDEKPFELKDGWVWCRLNEISLDSADGPFGSNLKREHYTENREVRIIQLSNIGELGWKDANVRYTTFEHLPNISRSEAFAGDIIIAKMMPAGRAIICPDHESKFVLSSDAVRFDFSNELYKKYLYYAINSSVFKEQVYGQVQGITRVRTSLNKLRTYILPLPPLPEQHRIVQKIEELMPLVEEYDKAQKELNTLNTNLPETLKKCILQEAIQGKLGTNNPDDEPASDLLKRIRAEKAKLVKDKKMPKSCLKETPINEEEKFLDIPDSWEWIRLEDIANLYTGNSINKEQKQLHYTNVEGTPYIGTKDVSFDGNIDYDNGVFVPENRIHAFRKARKGTVLMCIEGGSAGRKVGQLDRDVCFGNKLCCFDTYVDINDFIYYLLKSPTFKEAFTSNLNGIIGGVAIGNLAKLVLPLPPLQEQHRIVQKLNEILPKLKNLE